MTATRAPKQRDQVESAVAGEVAMSDADIQALAEQELIEEIARQELEEEMKQKRGDAAIGMVSRVLDPIMLGYSPQVIGGLSKAGAEIGELFGAGEAKDYVDYRDEAAKLLRGDTGNPTLEGASTATGVVASLFGPGLAAKGMKKVAPTLAEKIGKAVNFGGEGVLATTARGAAMGAGAGALTNPGEIEGQVSPLQLDERLQAMMPGALIGSTIGLVGGAMAAPGKIAQRFQTVPEVTERELNTLMGSANRQNVPLTIGTMTNQPLPRKLEVMLGESPMTAAGGRVAAERAAMYQGMQQAISRGTKGRADQDKAFIGQSMREHLKGMVDRIYKPIQDKYAQVMPELELAKVNAASLNKSMDYYKRMIERSSSILRDGPESKAILSWVEQIKGSRNARELDNAYSALNRLATEFRASGKGVPQELLSLMDGVDRQKRRAIVEAALESQGGRSMQVLQREGKKITGRERESKQLADSLIKDLKATDKAYAQFIESLENVGVKRGKVTRGTFLQALDSMSDEDLYNRLSKVNDMRFWEKLETDAPQVVELLRTRMMADIVEDAIPAGGDIGQISVQKFINKAEDLKSKSPTLFRIVFERRQPQFGDAGQMIEDIGLMSRRMPNIGEVNPSRTALAADTINQTKSWFSPRTHLGAEMQDYLYRNLMTPQSIGEAAARATRPLSIMGSSLTSRSMNAPILEVPKIEGFRMDQLRPVSQVELPLLSDQIAKDPNLSVTERARYQNLINKHRQVPIDYGGQQ